MSKITEEEIQKYIKPRNPDTGVDAITEEDLRKIDKDKLKKLKTEPYGPYSYLVDVDTNERLYYRYWQYVPCKKTLNKPSFAGRQFALGIVVDEIIFSDGVWFQL